MVDLSFARVESGKGSSSYVLSLVHRKRGLKYSKYTLMLTDRTLYFYWWIGATETV